jgi:hypothetical protein
MHIIQTDLSKYIDYKKSIFFIYQNYAHNLGTVDIHSFDDLTQKRDKLKKDNPGKTITIWAEKISLNHNFDKTLDAFEIGKFDANFYISDPLRKAIIHEKITGCDISTTKNIVIGE